MTKSLQDWFRIIVPGLMILFGVFTLLVPEKPFDVWKDVKIGDWAATLVAGFFLGVIYYAFDPRRRFLYEFIFNVTERKILDAVNSCALQDSHRLNRTAEGERIARSIFFRHVDSDNSLKVKGESIFLNGTLVSSCLDGAFIFGVIGTLHILLLPLGSTLHHLAWAVGLLVLAFFLFRVLLPKLGAKHEDLVDDQTSHLVQHHRASIGELLASRASATPQGDER